MQGEFATREIRHHLGPEQPRRLVGIDVENLPLTGEPTQEGRNDKLRDTLATKASTDKKVADVVLGTDDMGFVIHGHETGKLAVDLDQKRPGCRVAPVIQLGLDVEEAMLTRVSAAAIR